MFIYCLKISSIGIRTEKDPLMSRGKCRGWFLLIPLVDPIVLFQII